jgi:SAM-dependent methyltransferase
MAKSCWSPKTTWSNQFSDPNEVDVDRKDHWETVYRTKQPTDVSWFQERANLSVRIISEVVPDHSSPIIDVGGGASVLVSQLNAMGYANLTVLDLSGAALAAAKTTLGADAAKVHWIEADILGAKLPQSGYQFWHDRAVFHFLTDPESRAAYAQQVRRAVPSGGHVLIATFAADGPTRCSGLDVVRYSPTGLHAALGPGLALIAADREEHLTPSGANQAFTYCLFERE